MEIFKDFDYLFYLNIVKRGGGVLAMIISWSRNKSILMAIVHGFFGWLYVIYYYYVGKDEDEQKG